MMRIMLNSAETKIYPAHKCQNANNVDVYEQDFLALVV